ncbi:MAG: DUF4345 family protein [Anaerolineae bacterium]|jgi:hypothetical protein
MILNILKIAAAIGTIATGAISLIRPRSVRGFTGLNPDGPRGITEIRAVLGGFFIGLGAATLILNVSAAYQTLGIAYLVVAAVRIVSMLIDGSIESSNIISVVFEVVFGVILVL